MVHVTLGITLWGGLMDFKMNLVLASHMHTKIGTCEGHNSFTLAHKLCFKTSISEHVRPPLHPFPTFNLEIHVRLLSPFQMVEMNLKTRHLHRQADIVA